LICLERCGTHAKAGLFLDVSDKGVGLVARRNIAHRLLGRPVTCQHPRRAALAANNYRLKFRLTSKAAAVASPISRRWRSFNIAQYTKPI
jgi:hypothetical protein